MQFQAPYDIMDMRNQRMKEDALRQEQSMAQQEQIFGALGQLAGAYSENRQLEAKASSYDDIGKILNTAMFKDNPDAAAAFGNLQKEKDARKKVMGYEALFSMVGPMSNMMMAQGRLGLQQQAPYVDQMLDNQRDVAGGKATWTPGGGGSTTAPIEPALPEPAPAVVAPGPVASSVTDADRQRAMGWWQKKRSQGGP